jgi:hypothetical protein
VVSAGATGKRGSRALSLFIATIETTGGLVRLEDGRLYPAADEDSAGLADAYLTARGETGRPPLINGSNDPAPPRAEDE